MIENTRPVFKVLTLDGGGAKGVYSLGVLREVELLVGHQLCEEFQLIYGTSTGAVIAALLSLGGSVDEIAEKYLRAVPQIMGCPTAGARTEALVRHADELFGDADFTKPRTGLAIVTTDRQHRKPMIFKSDVRQAYTRVASFVPGFGCRIAEAVVASSAAVPFFKTRHVETANQGGRDLLDGGFVGNDPTLFAIADALMALSIPKEDLRILSVGVGSYPESRKNWLTMFVRRLWPLELLEMTLGANGNTLERIRALLFPNLRVVRISDGFPEDRYATSILETDRQTLNTLMALGRESYGRKEPEVRVLLGV